MLSFPQTKQCVLLQIVRALCEDPPESAFYMVGGIDEAIAKAKKLAAEERHGGPLMHWATDRPQISPRADVS